MEYALTIDLEDWYQGLELPEEVWSNYPSRVDQSTSRLLDLLADFNVKATFFVSGYIAERHQELIGRIADNGHEIGCHGYRHEFIYKLSRSEFASDLDKAVKILSKITGRDVAGYRAPYFSIVRRSIWALEILREAGFKYDSSIFPIWNYRYGMPGSPAMPYQISRNLWELPVTTGGFYLRFLPSWLFKRSFCKGRVLYLHPWELDPEQPRPGLPSRIKLTRYYHLEKTEMRLRQLLLNVNFVTASQLVGRQ